jgi:hypothetical protein
VLQKQFSTHILVLARLVRLVLLVPVLPVLPVRLVPLVLPVLVFLEPALRMKRQQD